ncbi:MAG TPA: peptidylprolyl isomerase [Planctomycetota bacterium]|nr:peptidylprolyl isomerase [Planctomycetota bacterium]
MRNSAALLALLAACEGGLPFETERSITLALGPDAEKFVYTIGKPFKVEVHVECGGVEPMVFQWPGSLEGGLEISEDPRAKEPTILKASGDVEYGEPREIQPPFREKAAEFDITEALKELGDKDRIVHLRWRFGKKASEWYRLVVVHDYKLTVNTNQGSFELELYPVHAPLAVMSFVKRVKEKFYDGAPVTVDPKARWMVVGDASKKDVPPAAQEPDAPDGAGSAGLWYDLRPDSASHLFFVRFAEPKDFMRRYTILGKVAGGQDTLQKIEAAGAGVVVESITVEIRK